MKSHTIPNAPQAIGPYCHAIQTGSLVFCSGQTPLDPDRPKKTIKKTAAEMSPRRF
jgi:2-iminobutanoate/2-iminopropanoate deaminase